ncbi:MAG: phosphoribosylglycinamide formyltransferase [Lysobacter sp.]|nr:phosphoribosylglycinamide formyltransferase [Lysobacter sp.]
MAVPRLAVLASGAGTNLQALIDAIVSGELSARIVGVFSDKPASPAMQRAVEAGVPATALSPKAFASRAAFDAALFAAIDAAQPDLIVCAGYMRLISAAEVEARPDRMINLHPSLLPAFKGLHTHQQALDAGVLEHGASVHVVTADLDGGPVIARARVPVLPGDSAETLAARVREQEHPLLVETVRLLGEGRLRLGGGRICLNDRALEAPLQLGANRQLA